MSAAAPRRRPPPIYRNTGSCWRNTPRRATRRGPAVRSAAPGKDWSPRKGWKATTASLTAGRRARNPSKPPSGLKRRGFMSWRWIISPYPATWRPFSGDCCWTASLSAWTARTSPSTGSGRNPATPSSTTTATSAPLSCSRCAGGASSISRTPMLFIPNPCSFISPRENTPSP